MYGQAVIVLNQAAFVINADIIAQYCFSAFPVPIDSHAVQPEAALVIMRIIVLENGITCGSPIRIKGCPVIFKQTGTSHLIALNQGIRDSTYPDAGNQPGILQTSQRPCIQADISVYQRGNTVGYNDSVASGSFNPVLTTTCV